MKCLLVFVAFAVIVTAIKGYSEDDRWKDYKIKHGKDYGIFSDGDRRDEIRKNIFRMKYAKITEHNKMNPAFRKGLNRFSDMNPNELSKYLGVNASLAPTARFMESISAENLTSRQLPPLSLDYRYDSCLPAVKQQGPCGSCWAFSAIAPLEFSRCKKVNASVVLSEQQLVDCDSISSGCNGGWYTNGWDYIKKVKGSAKNKLYTYVAIRYSCKFKTSMVAANVSNYNYVQTKNATAMQLALQKYGPLATAMTVVTSFYSYAGGVYDDPACDGLAVNHGVVVVGWGVRNGINYWIIRNSWGTNWGTKGYFLIKRGVNKCGIETYPAYVVSI